MESLPNPISCFTPTPDQAEWILHSITSRDTTLAHIGAHCKVTVETLCAWLATPAIRARLDAADTTTCHTIRIRANVLTPRALAAAVQILEDFTTIQNPSPSRGTSSRLSFDEALLAHRRAETARKAAVLILRLTNHQPAHARRAAPSTNTSSAPTPRTNTDPTAAPESPDQTIASALAALSALAEHVDTETTTIQPTPESSAAASAPIASAPNDDTTAPAPPDSQTPAPKPATVEHLLDLIATLSPKQIADLTALTSPEDLEPELALTVEDSS